MKKILPGHTQVTGSLGCIGNPGTCGRWEPRRVAWGTPLWWLCPHWAQRLCRAVSRILSPPVPCEVEQAPWLKTTWAILNSWFLTIATDGLLDFHPCLKATSLFSDWPGCWTLLKMSDSEDSHGQSQIGFIFTPWAMLFPWILINAHEQHSTTSLLIWKSVLCVS